MKKIIATVLAMVMALALCTVAFAAGPEVGDVYGVQNGKVTVDSQYDAVYTAAKDITYNTDGTLKAAGSIAYYTVNNEKYVVEDKETATHAVYTASGWVYIKLLDGQDATYTYVATKVGKLDKKCVKIGATTGDIDFYSTKNADGDVIYFLADPTAAQRALVDGKIVVFNADNAVEDLLPNHKWEVASYDTDNITPATYKCKTCKATAKVVSEADYLAAKAADETKVDTLANGTRLVLTSAVTPDNSKDSPKTFDAGIAMYVGMALTSVAGSAVVIGKKKEF